MFPDRYLQGFFNTAGGEDYGYFADHEEVAGSNPATGIVSV